jgi:hypothetical protein
VARSPTVPGMLRRILTALTFAALGAAGGAWLGWLPAAGVPTEQRARDIVAAAVPDTQAEFVDRFDVAFGYEQDYDYTPGFVTVTINYPEYEDVDLAVRAYEGFGRMGWTTSDTDRGGGFTAVGEGQWLLAYDAAWCGLEHPQACGAPLSSGPYAALSFRFQPAAPWPTMPLTVAGWLAGLAAGWSLGGRKGPDPLLCWPGLLLMLPATVSVTRMATTTDHEPTWTPLMLPPLAALTVVGGLLLVVALLAGRGRGDAPAAGGSAGASRSSGG